VIASRIYKKANECYIIIKGFLFNSHSLYRLWASLFFVSYNSPGSSNDSLTLNINYLAPVLCGSFQKQKSFFKTIDFTAFSFYYWVPQWAKQPLIICLLHVHT